MDIWADVVGLRQSMAGQTLMWPYGKTGQSGGYLVEGAASYGQFAEKSAGHKRCENGDPLTAVVVTHWRDKPLAAGKEKVWLSSMVGCDAVSVMKDNKKRSLVSVASCYALSSI